MTTHQQCPPAAERQRRAEFVSRTQGRAESALGVVVAIFLAIMLAAAGVHWGSCPVC